MIYFDVRKHFGKILRDNNLTPEFDDIARGIAYNIITREYEYEAPDDTSTFRDSIRPRKLENLVYMVRPYARSASGYDYPERLYHGTGKYRGGADQGVRGVSRVRSTNFYGFGNRRDMIGFFAGLAKRGVKMSIRPNKVSKRTVENAEPQTKEFIRKKIIELINKR